MMKQWLSSENSINIFPANGWDDDDGIRAFYSESGRAMFIINNAHILCQTDGTDQKIAYWEGTNGGLI